MSVDISDKAYQQYLENRERTRRVVKQMQADEGKHWTDFPEAMSYDQWVKVMHYREHPRWPQYVEMRQTWKDRMFSVHYGMSPQQDRDLKFPEFPEWLQAVEEVNRDYPDLTKKEQTNG